MNIRHPVAVRKPEVIGKKESAASRWVALGLAVMATLAAMLLQQGIRSTWQVRTLPERMMEWLLVFVPLDLFERGRQQFGANAKDIALVGNYVGMALVLVVAGWFSSRTLNAWVVVLLA